MATQLAREAGAYVIGTGRAAGRQTALDFGAQEFVDLENDTLEDVGGVDLVFDVLAMSAIPPKADIAQHGGNVCFVPKAECYFRLHDLYQRKPSSNVWVMT